MASPSEVFPSNANTSASNGSPVRIVEVWQSQSYLPIQGWGTPKISALHPHFLENLYNSKSEAFPDINPLPGWKWIDDWAIDKSKSFGDCDLSGWMYGVSYDAINSSLKAGAANGKESATLLKRKRRFLRTMTCVVDEALMKLNKEIFILDTKRNKISGASKYCGFHLDSARNFHSSRHNDNLVIFSNIAKSSIESSNTLAINMRNLKKLRRYFLGKAQMEIEYARKLNNIKKYVNNQVSAPSSSSYFLGTGGSTSGETSSGGAISALKSKEAAANLLSLSSSSSSFRSQFSSSTDAASDDGPSFMNMGKRMSLSLSNGISTIGAVGSNLITTVTTSSGGSSAADKKSLADQGNLAYDKILSQIDSFNEDGSFASDDAFVVCDILCNKCEDVSKKIAEFSQLVSTVLVDEIDNLITQISNMISSMKNNLKSDCEVFRNSEYSVNNNFTTAEAALRNCDDAFIVEIGLLSGDLNTLRGDKSKTSFYGLQELYPEITDYFTSYLTYRKSIYRSFSHLSKMVENHIRFITLSDKLNLKYNSLVQSSLKVYTSEQAKLWMAHGLSLNQAIYTISSNNSESRDEESQLMAMINKASSDALNLSFASLSSEGEVSVGINLALAQFATMEKYIQALPPCPKSLIAQTIEFAYLKDFMSNNRSVIATGWYSSYVIITIHKYLTVFKSDLSWDPPIASFSLDNCRAYLATNENSGVIDNCVVLEHLTSSTQGGHSSLVESPAPAGGGVTSPPSKGSTNTSNSLFTFQNVSSIFDSVTSPVLGTPDTKKTAGSSSSIWNGLVLYFADADEANIWLNIINDPFKHTDVPDNITAWTATSNHVLCNISGTSLPASSGSLVYGDLKDDVARNKSFIHDLVSQFNKGRLNTSGSSNEFVNEEEEEEEEEERDNSEHLSSSEPNTWTLDTSSTSETNFKNMSNPIIQPEIEPQENKAASAHVAVADADVASSNKNKAGTKKISWIRSSNDMDDDTTVSSSSSSSVANQNLSFSPSVSKASYSGSPVSSPLASGTSNLSNVSTPTISATTGGGMTVRERAVKFIPETTPVKKVEPLSKRSSIKIKQYEDGLTAEREKGSQRVYELKTSDSRGVTITEDSLAVKNLQQKWRKVKETSDNAESVETLLYNSDFSTEISVSETDNTTTNSYNSNSAVVPEQ